MRRKRVLILLAVMSATGLAIFWLGTVLAAATLTLNEGLTVGEAASGTITNSLLQADDPDVTGETLTYTLVTTPTNGLLDLNGTTLTPTSTFTQADIDSSLLVYTHDDSETASDSFDFTVETVTDTIPQTTFQITITPDFDQVPVVLDQEFSVAENSPTGTAVDTIVASDLDAGDSLTYTITGGNVGSPFAVGSLNGDVTVDSPTPLDFETNPTLTFTIQVEDLGMLTDTAVITVNVLDQNDPPVLSPAGPFDLAENSADTTPVGTPIVATDDDLGAGDVLTYTITAGNTDGAFEIGSSNGQIAVADGSVLDFDMPPTSYDLTIQVEDSAGATDEEVVTVNLTDVNEPPTTTDATYTPNENLGNTQLIGDVLADDPEGATLAFSITSGNTGSAFAVNTAGEIIVNDTDELDFETTPSFTLTVAVDDGVNTAVDATVFINLVDLNETPTISGATFDIDENSANGTFVGTVAAGDPDAADTNLLMFSILTGNTGGAFAIDNDGNNGRITVADTNQLDFETTQSFMLGIIVTDTGGLDNTATVTIDVNNLFDESPSVSNATFFVSQGAANGVIVGTVSATDPELGSGDQLNFSIIGGNTDNVFAINSSSGQITVPDTSKLDANAMPVFNLTVRAMDLGGQVDTATITINVSPLPITYIFLPTVLNSYPPIEPNNNCSQSYRLGSNINYEFTADDQEDWYSITLTSQKNVSFILSSFEPANGQLLVYGGTCGGGGLSLLQNNGSASTTKIINLNNLGPGTYFIRVFSAPISNTTYNLQVTLN